MTRNCVGRLLPMLLVVSGAACGQGAETAGECVCKWVPHLSIAAARQLECTIGTTTFRVDSAGVGEGMVLRAPVR